MEVFSNYLTGGMLGCHDNPFTPNIQEITLTTTLKRNVYVLKQ